MDKTPASSPCTYIDETTARRYRSWLLDRAELYQETFVVLRGQEVVEVVRPQRRRSAA